MQTRFGFLLSMNIHVSVLFILLLPSAQVHLLTEISLLLDMRHISVDVSWHSFPLTTKDTKRQYKSWMLSQTMGDNCYYCLSFNFKPCYTSVRCCVLDWLFSSPYTFYIFDSRLICRWLICRPASSHVTWVPLKKQFRQNESAVVKRRPDIGALIYSLSA